jgi:hypothetical protein
VLNTTKLRLTTELSTHFQTSAHAVIRAFAHAANDGKRAVDDTSLADQLSAALG